MNLPPRTKADGMSKEEAKEFRNAFVTEEVLGKQLKSARVDYGMSLAELGRRIGASNSAIIRWESGDNEIPLYRLLQVTRALDVDLRELLRGIVPRNELWAGEKRWISVAENGNRAEMSVHLKDLIESAECCEIYVGLSERG